MPALHFIEKGQGPFTLVFLHFFGGSANTWSAAMAMLSPRYRCIALDLRGFGASSAPNKPSTVQDHTNDVLELLDALQPEQFVVIGHSMGGKIAVSLAARRPKGLCALVLLAPSPPSPEPRSEQDQKDLLAAVGHRPALEKLVQKITVQSLSPVIFDQVVADHLRTAPLAWQSWIEVGSQEDISVEAALVQVPVRIISGAQDPVFSTAFLQEELGKYFPAAVFEEIPGSGHLLPLEAPDCLMLDYFQKFVVSA